MKISWNWLSDYVDLDGLSPESLGDILTMAGLELDGLETLGEAFAPIVVGQIESIVPHPDADKLVVCQVRWDDEAKQIVCGATNMEAGDKVPVIPAGNRLPDGTKIKKGKIRGQLSTGMMCSARELGLGDNHDGLLILSSDAPVGAPVADVLSLKDTVLDLSITPNRGDTLSYLGVAREVSALLGRERKYPGALSGGDPLATGTAGVARDHVSIEIEDPDGCPRYAAAVIRDVLVGPSPDWMVRCLESIGQRSVNNLVDISNFVMFETGQPLHIFDLDKLSKVAGKAQVVVRRAKPGESITSIDHLVRKLSEEDLLITDGNTPIAVAGVMGGVDSEVSDETRNILIECAHFDPRTVRRTGKRHTMNSESSHRFERFVDPNKVPTVLQRTAELVLATQPAGHQPSAASGIVDAYPQLHSNRVLTLRAARCNKIIGTRLNAAEMRQMLQSIDVPSTIDGGVLTVTVPSFRPDLEREIDLIEEVGRLFGVDKLEPTVPKGELGFTHKAKSGVDLPQPIVPPRVLLKLERVRDRLAAAGLFEAVNYAFVSPAWLELLGFAGDDPRSTPVELANPLSETWSVMRTSLLAGLLNNARHNFAHQADAVTLFEMGPVFLQDEAAPKNTGVRQQMNVAALIAGTPPARWEQASSSYDATDAKVVVEALFEELGIDFEIANHEGTVPYLHPGVGATILVKGEVVGVFGQVHPQLATQFELDREVFVLELSLDRLLLEWTDDFDFEPIPRYPSATRDLALVVDTRLPFGNVESAIGSFNNGLLESVRLSSVYEGDPIPAGKKSIALAVTYRSPSGSLTDKKIDAVHRRLADHVLEKTGAELR